MAVKTRENAILGNSLFGKYVEALLTPESCLHKKTIAEHFWE